MAMPAFAPAESPPDTEGSGDGVAGASVDEAVLPKPVVVDVVLAAAVEAEDWDVIVVEEVVVIVEAFSTNTPGLEI